MQPFIITLIACLLTVNCMQAQEYEVKALPVNEKYSNEMAPFMLDSTLYFCSDRRNSAFVNYTNQNNENIYRWYQATFSKGTWGKPALFYPALQNKINNGPLTFTPDGQYLAVTQNLRRSTASASTTAKMGIITYERKGERFSGRKTVPFNDITNYSVGHPSFSPDGQTLFFTSDMNKGYGKADIFMSEKINGVWSEPTNLGKLINTPANEIFPFYHPSGKLFFASDGLAGKGGFDIYYSTKVNGEWTQPIALGEPINSPSNDYGLYISNDEESGYFTSNREQSDNIYSFKQIYPEFSIKTPQTVDNFCFTFFEDGPYQADTIPVVYKWTFGDGKTADGKQADHCFNGPGNYHVMLNAIDQVQKVDLRTVADYQLDLVKTEQVFINAPDTIKTGEMVSIDASQSYLPSINPKEYYWDFGDGTKSKGIVLKHIFAQAGTYTISCGTIDKTDTALKYCSTKEIIVTD